MKKTAALIIAMMAVCGIARADTGGNVVAAGTYFSVYSDSQADAYVMLGKIDTNYLVHSASAPADGDSINDVLARTVDGLYQEVSDILDIHIYSFKGSIRVFPDRQALAAFFKKTHGVQFNERSLYYYEKDVIYISLADATVGILGHEMAHAIISHFFVVPPPEKVQEVLCGYVEYSLRKSRGTLP